MSKNFNPENYKVKMLKTLESFKNDLSSLRTGRANPKMLDILKVDVYGQKMPINQLGTVSAPEPRLISIQVWDQNNVNLIDSAIRKSDLGINPQIDGQLIRLPVPSLTEERRTELKKIIKTLSEKGKVSTRNIRREANDEIKKEKKDKDMGEDEAKKFEEKIQELTDDQIKEIDNIAENKEKEIMKIWKPLSMLL